MHGGIALASFQYPAGQIQSDGEVEPAGLVPTPPHEVHAPERPHQFSTHKHAVIAVEPAALTALSPHATHDGFVVGSFQKLAEQLHAEDAVDPLGAGLASDPHATQMGVAPNVSLKVPAGQSAVVGRQRPVVGSHIVPTPQSEELTAQNEDGFSPVATQQQRRS